MEVQEREERKARKEREDTERLGRMLVKVKRKRNCWRETQRGRERIKRDIGEKNKERKKEEVEQRLGKKARR